MVSYYETKGRKKKGNSVFKKVLNAFVDIAPDQEVLDLKMRYVDVLRGEEFLNDIKDLYIDKDPSVSNIDLEDIIAVLYENYLQLIKNGNMDHQKAANFLVKGKKKYLDTMKSPKENRNEFRQISPNTFILEDVEDFGIQLETANDNFDTSELVNLHVTLNNRDINRGKVFLYDINAYLNNEVLNVEDVMVISYLNLIHAIREKGNNVKVMESILYNLGYKDALE